MESFPTRVRRARSMASLSQAELARRIGVDRSSVTQWENPRGATPSVSHLIQIASETGVCFEWLATGRGPRTPEPGSFESALLDTDYASDALETRMLTAMRRLGTRRKAVAVQIVELLAG